MLVLTMIAKCAPDVLRRSLESVRPLVDGFVITVNPGDAKRLLPAVNGTISPLPGYMIEIPWRDTAQNRTSTFELARKMFVHEETLYFLVLDADDHISVRPQWSFRSTTDLTDPAYELEIQDGPISYWRPQIFRADLPYLRYVDAHHEYVTWDGNTSRTRLQNLVYHREPQVLTRTQQIAKYKKKIRWFKEQFQIRPHDGRIAYYYAQSLKDAFKFTQARGQYLYRATLGGWAEEAWSAAFEAAKLTEHLWPEKSSLVLRDYLAAYDRRPQRIEPLYALAHYLLERKQFASAHLFASAMMNWPVPENEQWLVDTSIYLWRRQDLASRAAYYAGHRENAIGMCRDLLENEHLPSEERSRIEANLACMQ